jgi:uncharacterized protein (DUF1800 family)
MDAESKAANAIADPDQKKAARDAYNKDMNALAREAQSRSLLRDLYGPDQLREQMTGSGSIISTCRRASAISARWWVTTRIQAIRPHALGRFRDLLEATLRHPAMLRYLDNDQNAATTSTRITPGRSWNSTAWAWDQATRRRTCRSWRAS